jgi:hypothetical protein
MWFFLWVLWFFLLFRVIMDIFRSRDLGGWGTAGWLVDHGVISDADYEQGKEKVFSRPAA